MEICLNKTRVRSLRDIQNHIDIFVRLGVVNLKSENEKTIQINIDFKKLTPERVKNLSDIKSDMLAKHSDFEPNFD